MLSTYTEILLTKVGTDTTRCRLEILIDRRPIITYGCILWREAI